MRSPSLWCDIYLALFVVNRVFLLKVILLIKLVTFTLGDYPPNIQFVSNTLCVPKRIFRNCVSGDDYIKSSINYVLLLRHFLSNVLGKPCCIFLKYIRITVYCV